MNGEGIKGMSLIVKAVTRLTLGFILLYGVYITLSGHSSCGGGFAGGVIVALALAHVMLAFGRETALKRLKPGSLRVIAGVGALGFLFVVTAGLLGGTSPVHSFLSGGDFEPLCEMVLVSSGLFAIFVALVTLGKGTG